MPSEVTAESTPTNAEASSTSSITDAATTTTEATTISPTAEAATTPTSTDATTMLDTTKATTTTSTTVESTTATSPTTTTSAELLGCENGWSLYRESCYRLSDFPHSFGSLGRQADCESREARPVSIGDAGENAFVSGLHQNFVARTNYDSGYDHLFIDLRRNSASGAFGWADGTPFGPEFYSNWAPDQPDNAGGTEDCVEMNHAGLWNDIACNSLRMWMCAKSAIIKQPTTSTTTRTTTATTTQWTTTTTTTASLPTFACQDLWGWRLYQQSCYKLHEGVRTFDAGLAQCQGQGAFPVTIGDASENAFVNQLQLNIRHTFVCSRGDGACQYMFIGLLKNGYNQFEWYDVTPLGVGHYSNWAPGEPQLAAFLDRCGEMRIDGKWNDITCQFQENDHDLYHSQHSIMCEKPAQTSWIPGQSK